jgi:group I intron endonuclease
MQVYKTTNTINGKIYIGKDVRDRAHYLGSGELLRRAIKKYGKENFQKEIIEVCSTMEELSEREKYWIEKYDSRNFKIGYNITEGGTGGDTYTNNPNLPEIKKKISEKMKGRVMTPEHIENLKKAHYSMDPVKRSYLSARQSMANKGKIYTEETRKKLSEANKGKIPSEETRKKLSDSLKGRPKSEEHCKKISAKMKDRMLSYYKENPTAADFLKKKRQERISQIVDMNDVEFTKWIETKKLYTNLGRRNGVIVVILRRRGEVSKYYN